MSFQIPDDSLFHQYAEAYRRFTWKGVRVFSGKKVLPKIQTQDRGNCIYVAVTTWMEASLRLAGITVELSPEDLEEKEINLLDRGHGRTINCLTVLVNVGICSKHDYEKKIVDCIRYSVEDVYPFFVIHPSSCKAALQSITTCPLLLVFHVTSNYNAYVQKFGQLPILSYEKFEEGRMEGHAACGTGYGVEEIVPFWEFMNSAGKNFPTGGFGRILPHDVYHVYEHKGIKVRRPARPNKRSRERFEDGDDSDGDLPPRKKQKKHEVYLMHQDYVMPPHMP